MGPENWQTICQVAMAGGAIIVALGGYGSWYFGKQMTESKSTTAQQHAGNGDNIVGDKYEFNYYGANRPQQSQIEIRRVSLDYPTKSGLKAELESQGYVISWSKDEMKAGKEPVIQTLKDGTRIMYKDSISGLTLLKSKAPIIAKLATSDKEFTKRTPHELLSFYTPERTKAEANRLLDPYIGQWITISGMVLDVGYGAPDGDQTAVILKDGNQIECECRFGKLWKERLDRLIKNESVKITGKISSSQNGSRLYLLDCEVT